MQQVRSCGALDTGIAISKDQQLDECPKLIILGTLGTFEDGALCSASSTGGRKLGILAEAVCGAARGCFRRVGGRGGI